LESLVEINIFALTIDLDGFFSNMCCRLNGTEHVEVKEAIVHPSYQGVCCRMSKAAQIAICDHACR